MSEDSINFTGSNVVAGNVGGRDNVAHVSGVQQNSAADSAALGTALEELRRELVRLRAALPAGTGTEAEPGDVDDVIDVLAEDEPDIERAVSRWTRLHRRIPESMRSLESISRIVDLIARVQELAT